MFFPLNEDIFNSKIGENTGRFSYAEKPVPYNGFFDPVFLRRTDSAILKVYDIDNMEIKTERRKIWHTKLTVL